MVGYVLGLDEIDRNQVAIAGGKGASLGELAQIDGVQVPAGFCVTTEGCRRILEAAPNLDEQLARLAELAVHDREAIRSASADIRRSIEEVAVPHEVAAEILVALAELGEGAACAVRSSATAEDLPGASFAGQQDTYLNVAGPAATLDHVTRCCASLFTERAVAYRSHNGFGHDEVQMAVVVQRMVFPTSAGVLFTADPTTGNRRVASVEAAFGLGEALVSGAVNPDSFTVREGAIVDRAIATKQSAIRAEPGGGTHERPVEPARQDQPALTDEQVLRLVELGRRIEAHFGFPQDIEWCLDELGFHVVQTRPITTLFPIPEAADDAPRVYVSVGHGQMMTEPMTPLGLSLWQLTSRAPMRVAGSRLFVDVTMQLSSPGIRPGLLATFGRSDPLIRDALETVLERGDLIPTTASATSPPSPTAGDVPEPIDADPSLVAELMEQTERSIEHLKRSITSVTGPALLDFILSDLQELRELLFGEQSHELIMSGMEAAWWLNDKMKAWLGEDSAADTLSLAAPHNVTAEMGLALLDVADVVRSHPSVVTAMRMASDDSFMQDVLEVDGGREAHEAIASYLDRYGMRCVGEIDVGRPRWSERPAALVPMILSNVDNFEPGERERRVTQGTRLAEQKAEDLLRRLRALPDVDAEDKAAQTEGAIRRVRAFAGFREFPKYGMIARYAVYKQAILEEAERLLSEGAIGATDDVLFLTFQELHEVVRTRQADRDVIARRRSDFRAHRALVPPRVLTSDGEAVHGSYRRHDAPAGALVGLAVSSGAVEGRARVIHDIAEADLEPGDILVTAHTDPSWSPLFVAVAGLVTEVGGLMTHGAVIAREYGLTAVVGVERATTLIEDGQRIRVDGTRGFVEIL